MWDLEGRPWLRHWSGPLIAHTRAHQSAHTSCCTGRWEGYQGGGYLIKAPTPGYQYFIGQGQRLFCEHVFPMQANQSVSNPRYALFGQL